VILRVLLALLLAVPALFAQERQRTASLVEVVSVRENKSGDTAVGAVPGGPERFGAINLTLRGLINVAYGGIPTSRILGGPNWADTIRFDVVGIGDPTQSKLLLLQEVLRDRFALRVRRESRQFDVYALVLARPNGNLGPGLRMSRDCSTAESRAKNQSGDNACRVSQRPGRITARGVQLTNVTGYLGAGRPVFERTGLKGYYDIDLEWAPSPTDDGPSLFTAVQEQLGLKLESTKAPLDVIVIEHAERPTEN
jgi:uncharacterized protein (TIGR03435 family)